MRGKEGGQREGGGGEDQTSALQGLLDHQRCCRPPPSITAARLAGARDTVAAVSLVLLPLVRGSQSILAPRRLSRASGVEGEDGKVVI